MHRVWAILFFLTSVVSSEAQTFIPGETYFDSTGFVEYRAGNLPIILSAPHGGDLSPDTIPDRDCEGCSYGKDLHTQEISIGVYEELHALTGCYPHLVINKLHRRKFDANRDIGDAADGNPIVEDAWYGYHAFIDSAKAMVALDNESGIFYDFHGHGHTIQRVELGYLLTKSELQLSDVMLNLQTNIDEGSIRSLVSNHDHGYTHAEILRDSVSFGTILSDQGFPAVPSLADPYPATSDAYFSGGYNTRRHGSRDTDGPIDGIQIELDQTARNSTNRPLLIDVLAQSILKYSETFYEYNLYAGCCMTNILHSGIINQGVFTAAEEIKSTATLNGDVIYQAGDMVVFDTSFCKVNNGKALEVIIDNCQD